MAMFRKEYSPGEYQQAFEVNEVTSNLVGKTMEQFLFKLRRFRDFGSPKNPGQVADTQYFGNRLISQLEELKSQNRLPAEINSVEPQSINSLLNLLTEENFTDLHPDILAIIKDWIADLDELYPIFLRN